MKDLKKELVQLKKKEHLLTDEGALQFYQKEQAMIERFLPPKESQSTTNGIIITGYGRF